MKDKAHVYNKVIHIVALKFNVIYFNSKIKRSHLFQKQIKYVIFTFKSSININKIDKFVSNK